MSERPVEHIARAISVRESTYQLITEAAKERGITRALLVRAAVEQYIARFPKIERRPNTEGGAA